MNQTALTAPTVAVATIDGTPIHPRLAIPPDQEPDFLAETVAARREIDRWRVGLSAVLFAEHGRKASIKKRVAAREGWSARQITNMITRWKKSGCDWRVLCDRRVHRLPSGSHRSPEFVEWVLSRFEGANTERSRASAWRKVRDHWLAWHRDPQNPDLAIPGYTSPPEPDPLNQNLPASWSYRTFCRLCEQSSEAGRKLLKVGPKAAHLNHGAVVRTTRHGLAPGEIYYVDDGVADNKVNYLGVSAKAVRPLYLIAIDALSGHIPTDVWKPQVIESVDGSAIKRSLNELDTFWLLVNLLTTQGYNPTTGTTIVLEHHTANTRIDERLEEFSPRLSNGAPAITLDRSGLYLDAKFKSVLMGGAVGGNPRYKALVEQAHSMIRNESMHLPGYVGNNSRHEKPEDLYGLEKFNDFLLREIGRRQLPAETVAKLKYPFPDWSVFLELKRWVLDGIAKRRDHRLEGWRDCGFHRQQWRIAADGPLAEQWFDDTDFGDLPADRRAAIAALIEADPARLQREVRLAPIEAWARGSSQLRKLDPAKVPLIAPDRAWRSARIGSGPLEFTIQDRWVTHETMRFQGSTVDARGVTQTLKRGTAYRVLLNPLNPDRLWVSHEDGSYIGEFGRINTPARTDRDGIVAELGRVAHIDAADRAAATNRARADIERRWADRKEAKAALDDTRTDAERDLDRQVDQVARRHGSGAAEDLIEAAPKLPAPTPDVDPDDIIDKYI